MNLSAGIWSSVQTEEVVRFEKSNVRSLSCNNVEHGTQVDTQWTVEWQIVIWSS